MSDASDLVAACRSLGASRTALVIRHAARIHDPGRLDQEPYLPLSDAGRRAAWTLGTQLPTDVDLHLRCSPWPRCRETALHIRGGSHEVSGSAGSPVDDAGLQPFFILNQRAVFEICSVDGGGKRFFRSWLKGEAPQGLMLSPESAIRRQLGCVVSGLSAGGNAGVHLFVTHDCNVHLLRHFCLKALGGDVEYLDGVAFLILSGRVHVLSHLVEQPVEITRDLLDVVEMASSS